MKRTKDKYMIGIAFRAHGRDDVGLIRQTLEQERLNKNPASTSFHLCYLVKLPNLSL